jgi:hypothetical protein
LKDSVKTYSSNTLVCLLALLSGCSLFQPPDASPGINRREMHALTDYYYWDKHSPAPTYSKTELSALIGTWNDPRLDGEAGETQDSRAAVALAAVGDEAFAAALSSQSETVKKWAAHGLSHLWKRFKLSYPKTQALLQPYGN